MRCECSTVVRPQGVEVLRVASVPESHIYVRHLAEPGDVTQCTGYRSGAVGWAEGTGRGWPPLMLEPGWVTDNHDRFDVFHVHFGFDAIAPGDLRKVVEELEQHDKPLVYTVHDLRNPHHTEPTAHDKQQDVLVAAAGTLITLTPGAARAVIRTLGSKCGGPASPPRAGQCPHRTASAKAKSVRRSGARQSVRANMDLLPVLDTLVPVIEALPGAVLQIDLHDEVFEPDSYWYAPELGAALREYGQHDHVEVRVHPSSLTTNCGITFPQSRSPYCPTASAPTQAGWRRVSTLDRSSRTQLRLLRRTTPV